MPVLTKEEHSKFLTFHNGLTMVAQEVSILEGGTIHLDKYSVCNGCQSLLTFYGNRKLLTGKMEVLVRIVKRGSTRKPQIFAYGINAPNIRLAQTIGN